MRKHIYVTSCDNDGGIYHYTFLDGTLTFCEKVELDRPMYTVVNNNKAYVLLRCTDEKTEFGGLVSFDIDTSGHLINKSAVISSQGIVPCHLCVDDNDIYAVNYLSGNLIRFPDKIVNHSGRSAHPTRQQSPHTHYVTFSPDNKYVLCTDLGVDTVFVYNRNLDYISSAKVPSGSGCRHLCVNGEYVYCVNELSSDVSVFSLKEGRLTLLNTYAAIPDYKGVSTAAAIRIYNNRLYISHRGADCISCFRINGETLDLLWNTPCGGSSPRDFDIVDGYIICANEGGNVTVLRLSENGADVVSNDIKITDPLCITVSK